MNALVPWNPRRKRTLWLDPFTGFGVDDDGAPVRVDGTAPATLQRVLDLAARCRVERVMLTGSRFARSWLLAPVTGWTPAGHYLDHEAPVGRYTHDVAQVRVELRRAVEWFGAGDYGPADARTAWGLLADVLAAAVPGAALLASPGATGREAWLRSRRRGAEPDPQVPDDVAELLRATSGQHRVELFAPMSAEPMPGLWYMDGRLMYAACVRELGTAPVDRLTGAQAADLLASRDGRYARARYRVTATVPDWWPLVGILPLAGADPTEGWTWPRDPGRTFTTWCDGAELHLALDAGWDVEPLEALRFTPGRPLDLWARRLLAARDAVSDDAHGPQLAGMVRSAVRWMLLHSIGAWHSTGRTETTITDTPMQRPAGDGWDAPEILETGRAIWHRRVPLTGRAALMAHPEWSAQVWGRARARVLDAPTTAGRIGVRAGALNVDLPDVVSIYGDAVMTTRRPAWAAPELDDGKVGRLRVKGHLHGPLDWPARGSDRDRLSHLAETYGPRCEACPDDLGDTL